MEAEQGSSKLQKSDSIIRRLENIEDKLNQVYTVTARKEKEQQEIINEETKSRISQKARSILKQLDENEDSPPPSPEELENEDLENKVHTNVFNYFVDIVTDMEPSESGSDTQSSDTDDSEKESSDSDKDDTTTSADESSNGSPKRSSMSDSYEEVHASDSAAKTPNELVPPKLHGLYY